MLETNYPRLGERVSRCTLKSGAALCVVHKPEYQKCFAFFATRYGSMDMQFRRGGKDFDTPAGIAHYLEHKMFDTEDGNALQELSQNGADPNAFTSNAMTAYYFDCTEHFEQSLRILLSFVSVPYFTTESVEKERGIIAQEIRMIEDDPEWQVYARLMACLYRRSPARIPVAGTVESIAEITAETLYDCHRAFYHPANMILCVVGNVDAARIRAVADEVLPVSPCEEITRCYGDEESLCPAAARSTLAMEVSMPQFLLGFKCAAVEQGEAMPRQSLIASIACDILLGESSPLYTRLYEEGLINAGFGAGFDQLPGIAYLCAGGESRDPDAVCEAILAEAERLAREGVDEDFYQQMRRAYYGSTLRSFASFENIASAQASAHFHGYDSFRLPEVFESVTRADVEQFLRETIRRERMALSLIVPKEEQAS